MSRQFLSRPSGTVHGIPGKSNQGARIDLRAAGFGHKIKMGSGWLVRIRSGLISRESNSVQIADPHPFNFTPRISTSNLPTKEVHMKGSKGGQVQAVAQRSAALATYAENPVICKGCGAPIPVPEGQKVSAIRRRSFCSRSCSARCSNQGVNRRARKAKTHRLCAHCGQPFVPKGAARFCSDTCRKEVMALYARSRFTSEMCSKNRKAQIETEEAVAQRLRDEGWEVFSPTVVCDRVGIKDGQVFFLEFKPEGRETLRAGQQRVCDCAPHMYRVITHE